MANKPMNKRIEGYQVEQRGYQPKGTTVALGHQPRPQAMSQLQFHNLKHPKGGSSIQTPKNGQQAKQ